MKLQGKGYLRVGGFRSQTSVTASHYNLAYTKKEKRIERESENIMTERQILLSVIMSISLFVSFQFSWWKNVLFLNPVILREGKWSSWPRLPSACFRVCVWEGAKRGGWDYSANNGVLVKLHHEKWNMLAKPPAANSEHTWTPLWQQIRL